MLCNMGDNVGRPFQRIIIVNVTLCPMSLVVEIEFPTIVVSSASLVVVVIACGKFIS